MDNKNLEIKFGGDVHEISIDLLIESLISYSSVTQETAAYLSPGIKADIKIKATKQGSFILLLNLITENVGSLFVKDNISLAAEIITIVGGLYGLKKWISRNGKPEIIKQVNDNEIEISNNKGKIIITGDIYNIYQESPKVRESLRNTFVKLQEKEEIDSFEIKDTDSGSNIFIAEKKDFPALASDNDEIEQRRQKVIKDSQELSVFKVVFKENYKWEFFYLGTKIYASIKDEDYFKKIERGDIAFRSGDKLIVDLEIEQVFNEAANTFVNDSYNILKVIEHIPRTSSTQHLLSFE